MLFTCTCHCTRWRAARVLTPSRADRAGARVVCSRAACGRRGRTRALRRPRRRRRMRAVPPASMACQARLICSQLGAAQVPPFGLHRGGVGGTPARALATRCVRFFAFEFLHTLATRHVQILLSLAAAAAPAALSGLSSSREAFALRSLHTKFELICAAHCLPSQEPPAGGAAECAAA